MKTRDREHSQRVLEAAEAMRKLSEHGRFRSDAVAVERVHLRAIFLAESADHLSPGFKDRNRPLWDLVRTFRNRVLHTYETVDPEELWRFIRDDLPGVETELRRARFD